MAKKIIRPIVFAILTAIVLLGVYKIVSWKDTTGDYQSSTKQLYNTDKDMIDVVFLGSSHCYTNIYPCFLWENYGIAAFDMAVSGQDKNSTYYDLREVLKTQSPSVVCVDMYGLLFEEQAVQGNVYRNMLALKTSEDSINLVKSYVEEDKWGDYILRWPIVHTRYRELQKLDFIENEINEYMRGEGISFDVGYSYFPAEAYSCSETTELSETNLEWIEKMYALSLEKEFQLVFFMAPFTATVEDQKIVNTVSVYAANMDIPFIDFNKITPVLGYDYEKDASDYFHSNANGAAKITGYFGEFLESNYYLPDHRGDEKYSQWEKDYQYFLHREQENILNSTSTFDSFVKTARDMKNVVVFISLDGYYQQSIDYMKAYGLSSVDCENGGKWIYRNGEATFIMDNDSEEKYLYDLNKYDTVLIQNADDSLNNIMMGNTPLNVTENGMNVIVYDTFQKKVIAQRGE